MCVFDRIAGFLIGAQVAYIAMLAFLVAAAVASGSVFGAGASVGLMIGAILSLAVCTGLFIAALADLNNCQGPCSSTLNDVRSQLTAMIVVLAIVLVMLIALAIVAPVPVAGAVAITPAVFWLTTGAAVLITIDGCLSVALAMAFSKFNDCQASNSQPSNSTLVTVFGILSGIAFVGSLVVGLNGGLLWALVALLITATALGWSWSVTVDQGDQGSGKGG
jgi:hypothetical protein